LASPIQFSGRKLDIEIIFCCDFHNLISDAVAALRIERAHRVAHQHPHERVLPLDRFLETTVALSRSRTDKAKRLAPTCEQWFGIRP
jgi:hypothetical protein